MAVSEFVLVYFIAPAIPGVVPLPTPTMDLLATPTTTLPADSAAAEGTPVNPVPIITQLAENNTCIPDQVQISFPIDLQEVNGVVEVLGTANIPNFGFYKLEIKRPDESIWLTLQAGNTIVQNGKLGDWDTRRLTPGEYQLGLVVVDNEAQSSPPCVVQLRVSSTPEGTPGP
jgi:hypothetical protein